MAFGGFGATPTGAAPAPAFGAASSTPAFGAASMPAFGAAAASPAFGAASAPAFGAASTQPAFGATSAPLFGASSSSPFGGSSTPAFGGGGGGGLFGAPATSAPGLFGAAASTPAFGASPGGGLFGSSSSSPAFSFSSQPAAAASPSPFGSALGFPAGGASSSSSFFGAAPAAAGAPGALTTQLAPMAQSIDAVTTIFREIEKIKSYYTPTDPLCKFRHIFNSVVENPASRVRPQDVDEITWQQALAAIGGADNPDRLWPVVARGFSDLLARGQAQEAALGENAALLEGITKSTHQHECKQGVELAGRIAAVRSRHLELTGRLLGLARQVDALEARVALAMGLSNVSSSQRDTLLGKVLERIEGDLSPASAGGLQRRLDAVAATARLKAAGGGVLGLEGAGGGGNSSGGGGGLSLDPDSEAQLFGVLKEHVAAVKQLQEVLRRDLLDLDVIKGPAAAGVAPAGLSVSMMETG